MSDVNSIDKFTCISPAFLYLNPPLSASSAPQYFVCVEIGNDKRVKQSTWIRRILTGPSEQKGKKSITFGGRERRSNPADNKQKGRL